MLDDSLWFHSWNRTTHTLEIYLKPYPEDLSRFSFLSKIHMLIFHFPEIFISLLLPVCWRVASKNQSTSSNLSFDTVWHLQNKLFSVSLVLRERTEVRLNGRSSESFAFEISEIKKNERVVKVIFTWINEWYKENWNLCLDKRRDETRGEGSEAISIIWVHFV